MPMGRNLIVFLSHVKDNVNRANVYFNNIILIDLVSVQNGLCYMFLCVFSSGVETETRRGLSLLCP